ncbi:hypothetical protein I6E29_05240 [Arcanobacterium haemolyticum]|nr:hypothetical protein [Arcanobacterium haemolyticum]
MAVFALEGGRLVPAQYVELADSGVVAQAIAAIRERVVDLLDVPLFPVAWQSGERESLIALDPTGQIVTVEVLARLDSAELLSALARAGGHVELSRSQLAALYGPGATAFPGDWRTFLDACEPHPAPGPRLFLVVLSLDDDVRPAIQALSGAGLNVSLASVHDGGSQVLVSFEEVRAHTNAFGMLGGARAWRALRHIDEPEVPTDRGEDAPARAKTSSVPPEAPARHIAEPGEPLRTLADVAARRDVPRRRRGRYNAATQATGTQPATTSNAAALSQDAATVPAPAVAPPSRTVPAQNTATPEPVAPTYTLPKRRSRVAEDSSTAPTQPAKHVEPIAPAELATGVTPTPPTRSSASDPVSAAPTTPRTVVPESQPTPRAQHSPVPAPPTPQEAPRATGGKAQTSSPEPAHAPAAFAGINGYVGPSAFAQAAKEREAARRRLEQRLWESSAPQHDTPRRSREISEEQASEYSSDAVAKAAETDYRSATGRLLSIVRRHRAPFVVVWQQRRHGISYQAEVTAWGTLVLSNGAVFTDPTLAAQAASGRLDVDGWKVWKVADGRSLGEL